MIQPAPAAGFPALIQTLHAEQATVYAVLVYTSAAIMALITLAVLLRRGPLAVALAFATGGQHSPMELDVSQLAVLWEGRPAGGPRVDAEMTFRLFMAALMLVVYIPLSGDLSGAGKEGAAAVLLVAGTLLGYITGPGYVLGRVLNRRRTRYIVAREATVRASPGDLTVVSYERLERVALKTHAAGTATLMLYVREDDEGADGAGAERLVLAMERLTDYHRPHSLLESAAREGVSRAGGVARPAAEQP